MSSQDFMGDRRKSLEDEFFHAENKKLLNRLREENAKKENRAAVMAASGIQDEAVVDAAVDMGLTAETMLALSMVPLVEVAWADRKMEPDERDAVLKAAEAVGVQPGSATHELLEGWLERKPGRGLFQAWQEYVAQLKESMAPGPFRTMGKEWQERARKIAASAGGYLGIGTVSREEKDVLKQIEQSFGL